MTPFSAPPTCIVAPLTSILFQNGASKSTEPKRMSRSETKTKHQVHRFPLHSQKQEQLGTTCRIQRAGGQLGSASLGETPVDVVTRAICWKHNCTTDPHRKLTHGTSTRNQHKEPTHGTNTRSQRTEATSATNIPDSSLVPSGSFAASVCTPRPSCFFNYLHLRIIQLAQVRPGVPAPSGMQRCASPR